MVQFSRGVVFVALISTICGIAMTGISSWVLHRYLQARKNPTLATATDLIHQVNTFFGGTTGLYDLDVIFRIFISCSATALVGGGIQFLTSFSLLICGASGKMSRKLCMFWVTIQFFVILAIGGALLCILTNELEIHKSVSVFLISAGVDVGVIILCCVILIFSLRQTPSVRTRNLDGVHYSGVAKSNPPPEHDNLAHHYNMNQGNGNRKQFNGVQVLPSLHKTSSSSRV